MLDHHLIYDSILDDAKFEALPGHLAEAVGARSCWMLWQNASEDFTVASHSGHWSPLEIQSYASEGAPRDPLVLASRQPGVINRFARASSVLGQEAFVNSDFYNEQVRPTGSGTYWIAGASFDTAHGMGTIGIHREKSAGDFSDSEIRMLSAANEDIRRMLAIRAELNAARRPSALDMPLRATLRLDHTGRILDLDAAAERMMSDHAMLHYHRQGLTIRGTLGTLYIERLRRATNPAAPRPDILRIPGPSADMPDLQLNFIPDLHAPGQAVVIIAQRARPRDELSALTAPPRITEREREILLLMIAGERRDRIAFSLGIAVPTVDLHLGKLRRKMSARTLPEMVAEAVRWGLV